MTSNKQTAIRTAIATMCAANDNQESCYPLLIQTFHVQHALIFEALAKLHIQAYSLDDAENKSLEDFIDAYTSLNDQVEIDGLNYSVVDFELLSQTEAKAASKISRFLQSIDDLIFENLYQCVQSFVKGGAEIDEETWTDLHENNEDISRIVTFFIEKAKEDAKFDFAWLAESLHPMLDSYDRELAELEQANDLHKSKIFVVGVDRKIFSETEVELSRLYCIFAKNTIDAVQRVRRYLISEFDFVVESNDAEFQDKTHHIVAVACNEKLHQAWCDFKKSGQADCTPFFEQQAQGNFANPLYEYPHIDYAFLNKYKDHIDLEDLPFDDFCITYSYDENNKAYVALNASKEIDEAGLELLISHAEVIPVCEESAKLILKR